MTQAALLCGIGTSGVKMANGVLNHVRRELGRIPGCCNYLMVDGASKDWALTAADPGHFICIDVAGCGTDPRRGQDQFYLHYDEICRALLRQMQGIHPSDVEVPVDHLPRQVLGLWLFAGCGGTSGGILHPMISLAHDVAQRCRIPQLRVHLVLMGPDMPMRDSSRSVLIDQMFVTADAYCGNLVKVLVDVSSADVLDERRPDGTTFRLPAWTRVWSIHVEDQSNGAFEWSVTEDLIDMIAWQSFLEIFTALGKFVEDRVKDHEELGVTARRTLKGTA